MRSEAWHSYGPAFRFFLEALGEVQLAIDYENYYPVFLKTIFLGKNCERLTAALSGGVGCSRFSVKNKYTKDKSLEKRRSIEKGFDKLFSREK